MSTDTAIAARGLTRVWNSKVFSDITLVFSGRRVQAHKIILVCQSDYFRAMFEGQFSEAAAKEVELCEDDPEALEAMLRGMYGFKITHTFGHVDVEWEAFIRRGSKLHDQCTAHVLKQLIEIYLTARKYLVTELSESIGQDCCIEMALFQLIYGCVYSKNANDSAIKEAKEVLQPLYKRTVDGHDAIRLRIAKCIFKISATLNYAIVNKNHHNNLEKLFKGLPELRLDYLNYAWVDDMN